MKTILSWAALIIFALLLVGCGSTPTAAPKAEDSQPPVAVVENSTPTPFAEAYLTTEYADATSLRNQLAYGTLKLEGTDLAITAVQAQSLLPLWQAIVALSGIETTAAEELTAVQNQITEALTPAQLQVIAAQQISNADLSAFYAEQGVVLPTPAPGVTKVPGSGKNISQEDKEATRTAATALGTPVGTGGGAGQVARTLLFDLVVELLTERAAQ
jgi:hypothetical protein